MVATIISTLNKNTSNHFTLNCERNVTKHAKFRLNFTGMLFVLNVSVVIYTVP